MKKFLTVLLTIAMVLTLGVSAFANAFVESPSNNRDPRLIRFTVDGDCDGEIIITPFSKRATLPSDELSEIGAAYNEIKATTDLTVLVPALSEIAKKNNINTAKLAVSDLFDLRVEGCTKEAHKTNGHGTFTIVVEDQYLSGYVALLHRHEGQWHVVSNATVNGKEITFEIEEFSPFAIAVNSDTHVPPTSDNYMIWIWIAVAAVAATGCVVFMVLSKKGSKKS